MEAVVETVMYRYVSDGSNTEASKDVVVTKACSLLKQQENVLVTVACRQREQCMMQSPFFKASKTFTIDRPLAVVL